MKTICLYFEIHQIIHLKRYRFFDIGTDHYYYDDYENDRSINDIAERSYMPALNMLLQMIHENGKYFKVAFSLSGVGLEQLEMHAPQVLDKLQELNNTGCVEFLAEPYSHGLSSLANEECFMSDVKKQATKIKEYFGQDPKVLRNSSLIYSNDIGLQAAQMGFKGMLTEGAKHVLGWKSPHYLYNCIAVPGLKLLLRDVRLSDDVSLRFSNSDWDGYPLFADNYVDQIAALPEEEQIINIFMELSALGIAQPLSSNILDFLHAIPTCAKQRGITFSTPAEICKKMKSVGSIDVPDTLSWVDEERDISCWLGNDMQREAFNKLYSIADRVRIANDPRINQDWDYLQASNNFRFMTTKPSNVGLDRGIYASPFDAFTNYMNILGDFMSRVNSLYPEEIDNEELSSLLTTIHNQEDEIDMKEKEITRLQTKIQKMDEEGERLRAKLEKYEPIVGNNEDVPVAAKPVKKGSTSRTTNKKSTTKKPIVARKSAKKQD
jgi:alpha-amylase